MHLISTREGAVFAAEDGLCTHPVDFGPHLLSNKPNRHHRPVVPNYWRCVQWHLVPIHDRYWLVNG